MSVAHILAATLQMGFVLPTQLSGPECGTSGMLARTPMTAHVRLFDAGWRALAQDSVPYSLPGDHVVFRWELPPGTYWVEAWASNRVGSGCPTRRAFQVSNLPGDRDSPPPADAEIYELFDLSGRRLAKGRGEWKAEGLRPGIYWLRRTRAGQAVTRRLLIR